MLFVGLSPQYILDLITIKQPTRYGLRSQDSIALVPPKGKSMATLGDRSFSVAAPKVWNGLSKTIRNITCIKTFKSAIKAFLF